MIVVLAERTREWDQHYARCRRDIRTLCPEETRQLPLDWDIMLYCPRFSCSFATLDPVAIEDHFREYDGHRGTLHSQPVKILFRGESAPSDGKE